MFDRYNIVTEDNLRMAAQKTTLYVARCRRSGFPGDSMGRAKGARRVPVMGHERPFREQD
jgi:hypothetical protein